MLLRVFDVCLTNPVSMYKYWKKKCFAWIHLKEATQCVLVLIDVVSNPLMYFFFFFFCTFWNFRQRINKWNSDSCWNKPFLKWPLWILCFPPCPACSFPLESDALCMALNAASSVPPVVRVSPRRLKLRPECNLISLFPHLKLKS